jgi:hypothetical protein
MSKALIPINETADLHPDLAACSQQERVFIQAYCEGGGSYGSIAAAVRVAQYGTETSGAKSIGNIGQRLLHYPRIVAGIAAYTKTQIRSLAPLAVAAVRTIVDDPTHKDRLKAANSILERIDPVVTKHEVTVEHIDHNAELIKLLRKDIADGASRNFLEKRFGPIGLARLEEMLSIEDQRNKPQPVDVEFEEVSADGLEDLL